MMNQFTTGIWHSVKALSFMFSRGLWHYYLYPILVSILFYALLIGLMIQYAYSTVKLLLSPYIPEKMPEINGFWDFLNIIGNISVYGAAAVLISLLTLFLASRFSKYIVLMILAPVFSVLSEKIDSKISGQVYQFEWIQLIKDMLRGIAIALRNLFIELVWTAIITVATIFSGGIALIASPLLFVISAYFYGFSMIDYTCERRKLSIQEGVQFVRKYKWFALGNGIVYLITDMVPGIGSVLAPVNGICGATTGILELEKASKS
jgi:CysZ protein